MAVITLSFYDPSDGSLLGTLDDTQCKQIQLRPALFELGAGSFTVSRHLAAAQIEMLQKGVIVIPTIPVVSSTPFWGFILADELAVLISHDEQGGEDITLSGPGIMSILGNATLDEETFAPVPPASEERGSSDTPGEWLWRNQPQGAILSRAVEEGVNQPGTPLGLVTENFTRTHDSVVSAWEVIVHDYTVPTGTNVLELCDRLAQTGEFYPIMRPVITAGVLSLQFSVYQVLGSDLSGSISFEKGVNILTELSRQLKYTRVTHLLTKDADGNWERYVTANAYDQATYGFLDIPETNDPDTIERIATTALDASELNNEEFELEIIPSLLPFSDFNLGDEVNVHTGSGEHDLNNTAQRLVACRFVLDEAAVTGQERSLRVVLELSYREMRGMAGTNETVRSDSSGAHRHPPNPQLCRPSTLVAPVMDEGHVYAEDENLTAIATFGMDVTGGADTALVVLAAHDPTETGEQPVDSIEWRPSGALDLNTQALTRIFGPSDGMEVWALLDPNPATSGSALLSQDASGSTWFTSSFHLIGIDEANPWRSWATATGSSATSSVTPTTVATDLVLNAAGWFENNATVATPTAGGGQTSVGTDTHDVAFGQRDCSMGGGWQEAAGTSVTPTWAFGASHAWKALALVVAATGTSGDGPPELVGTGIRASRCDHGHLHGYVPDAGDDHHDAAAITYDPSDSGLAATDVQAAIDELTSAAGSPLRWEAVTDGEDVFVWVGDDLVHEWKEY